MKPSPPLRSFLLGVLLWAPLCFIAWHFISDSLLIPVRWLSEFFLTQYFPTSFSTFEQQGIVFDVVTPHKSTLLPSYRAGQPVGLIIFSVDALKYCYGTPLLVAMTLAVPGSIKNKLICSVVGALLLIPFQSWGVSCDTLATLAFKLGTGVAAELGMSKLTREVLALSYQLGYLILPPLVPVMLWGSLNRKFLEQLAPNLRRTKS